MKRRRPPAPEPLPAPAFDATCHLDMLRAGRGRARRRPRGGISRVYGRLRPGVVALGGGLRGRARRASTRRSPSTRTRPLAADADRGGTRCWPRSPRLAALPEVRAVGETGLDYYRDYAPPELQRDWFRAHIEIAKAAGKALVIHDRDAHDDVLDMLAQQGAPEHVVFHCFSGDAEMAKRCADAGYVMSFAGNVTFPSAGSLREAAAVAPGRADPGRDRRAVPDPGPEPGQAERPCAGRAHAARDGRGQADGRRRAVRGGDGDRRARVRPWHAVACARGPAMTCTAQPVT